MLSLISKVLFAIGLILLFVCVGLWFQFYQWGLPGNDMSLWDVFPCLYSRPTMCTVITQAPQLAGSASNSPALFWAGICCFAISMVTGLLGGPPRAR